VPQVSGSVLASGSVWALGSPLVSVLALVSESESVWALVSELALALDSE
jgi:hypothetical protein